MDNYSDIRMGLMGTPMDQSYGQNDYGNPLQNSMYPMSDTSTDYTNTPSGPMPSLQRHLGHQSQGASAGGDPNNPLALIHRQNQHILSGEVNNPGQDYMYSSWLDHV